MKAEDLESEELMFQNTTAKVLEYVQLEISKVSRHPYLRIIVKSILTLLLDVNPPAVQLESLDKLISCAVETNKLRRDYKVIGHRQGKATTCPGDKLYALVKKMSHWESNPN